MILKLIIKNKFDDKKILLVLIFISAWSSCNYQPLKTIELFEIIKRGLYLSLKQLIPINTVD